MGAFTAILLKSNSGLGKGGVIGSAGCDLYCGGWEVGRGDRQGVGRQNGRKEPSCRLQPGHQNELWWQLLGGRSRSKPLMSNPSGVMCLRVCIASVFIYAKI